MKLKTLVKKYDNRPEADYVINFGNNTNFDGFDLGPLEPSGDAFKTSAEAIEAANNNYPNYQAVEVVLMPEDNDNINEVIYRVFKVNSEIKLYYCPEIYERKK